MAFRHGDSHPGHRSFQVLIRGGAVIAVCVTIVLVILLLTGKLHIGSPVKEGPPTVRITADQVKATVHFFAIQTTAKQVSVSTPARACLEVVGKCTVPQQTTLSTDSALVYASTDMSQVQVEVNPLPDGRFKVHITLPYAHQSQVDITDWNDVSTDCPGIIFKCDPKLIKVGLQVLRQAAINKAVQDCLLEQANIDAKNQLLGFFERYFGSVMQVQIDWGPMPPQEVPTLPEGNNLPAPAPNPACSALMSLAQGGTSTPGGSPSPIGPPAPTATLPHTTATATRKP